MSKTYKYPTVLTIAGSDSGGGAGIQADLKTFSALGCFGTSAITAITVQNTVEVKAIHSIPTAIVYDQIRVVMDDIKPSAIKVGMVHSAELAKTIVEALRNYPNVPIVMDPVMVATSGDKLIEDSTISVLMKKLFPLSTVITPNLDEGNILADMQIQTVEEMKIAAGIILKTGCKSVLLKGGHLKGNKLFDVFIDNTGNATVYGTKAIKSHNTHGTGCTLSSAIAAFLAREQELVEAIKNAKEYIHKALDNGKDVKTGEGHGPLNHFFDPKKLLKLKLDDNDVE